MADIKKAAKWMNAGLKVRRPHWHKDYSLYLSDLTALGFPAIVSAEDELVNELDCDDLLADDWVVDK